MPLLFTSTNACGIQPAGLGYTQPVSTSQLENMFKLLLSLSTFLPLWLPKLEFAGRCEPLNSLSLVSFQITTQALQSHLPLPDA